VAGHCNPLDKTAGVAGDDANGFSHLIHISRAIGVGIGTYLRVLSPLWGSYNKAG
jgi:hypothetical protein